MQRTHKEPPPPRSQRKRCACFGGLCEGKKSSARAAARARCTHTQHALMPGLRVPLPPPPRAAGAAVGRRTAAAAAAAAAGSVIRRCRCRCLRALVLLARRA
jgi:hypothetical protein